jgi:molecular chaperone DnaJ
MSNGGVKQDYYELLGVEHDASDADIKRAYRKMAREYHPDVNRDNPEAEEIFKQISEAYAVLSDPERRARYDRFGPDGQGDTGFGGSPMDIFDIFASAFGGDPFGFGRSAGRTVEVGRSLRYDLQITLEDVLKGVEREITYSRLATCEACDGTGTAPGTSTTRCATCGGVGRVRSAHNTFLGTISSIHDCPDCHGTGEIIEHPCEECKGQAVVQRQESLTISVPAGIQDGEELVLRGFGEAPVGGGRVGDLYVRVRVRQHKRFARHGDDLQMELPITFTQAALGDTRTIDGLDGPVEISLRAGLQTGSQVTISGRGLPRRGSTQRGDLHVYVRVTTPTDLTDRQRELLMQFAAERGEELQPDEDKGLFERLRDAFTGRQ